MTSRHSNTDEDELVEPAAAVAVQLHAEPRLASNLRVYRGGFHSSICDIFKDPSSRTDCCAVACCGVLSSDRTHYLLTGEHPPPLWKRVAMYLIIPAIIVAAMNYFAIEVPITSSSDASDEDSKNQEEPLKVAPFPLTLLFLVYIIFLICYAKQRKISTRKVIMSKLQEEHVHARGQEIDPLQLQSFLLMNQHDIFRAHRLCCCYEKDGTAQQEIEPVLRHDGTWENKDFCTVLWEFLSNTCCGMCCGCWCQCCSICALAQEEREVNRLTGNQNHTMDYVTFQPYTEYYPSIQDLKRNQITSLLRHFQTLSDLSNKLLKNVAAVLIILVIFALSNIDQNFTWQNLIVLLLTLGQAFFIEYLVHWRSNRFDLSLDSVVKFFACGFFITTPMAVMFELVVSSIASFIVLFVFGIVFASDSDLAHEMQSDQKKGMQEFTTKYKGLFIVYIFINSFIVAALIEEMVKYFGYWMVVVPDLLPEERSHESSRNVISNDSNSIDQNNMDYSSPTKNAKSSGTGITVAMVSVALGFACCENLMYVFVYAPPTLGMEISTLVARSLFPVHPLCAAIQSIGVCKRDIEGDRKWGLGRIISPAVLLHGSFDFVLMLAAFLAQVQNIEEGNNDDTAAGSSTEDVEDLKSELPSLISGLVLVICGVVYYVVQSRAQVQRLMAMDSVTRDQSALLV